MNFNQATFIGRLTEDAKAVETTTKPFTSFSMAVNESYEDREGNRVEAVEYISVTLNGTGRVPYLKKGTPVLVVGRVRAEAYLKEGGDPVANLRLFASQFEFADSKKPQAETA